MTIQFPAVMPAGGEAAASGAPTEAPTEGFAAMIDALIAALTEECAAGDPGAAPLDENTAEEEIDAVLDAVGLVAEFGLIPDAVPITTTEPVAVVVSVGPATGPGAILPGCGCCSGHAVVAAKPDAAPVQAVPESAGAAVPESAGAAVPESAGAGFEGVSTGTSAESAVPAARVAAPSVLTTQIVERVVELVQRQQAITPPSTMVIELPEMVGARIAVTMHSSGVHLAFTGLGSSDLNPLIPQLQSGLAAAGMNLAGWSADADGGNADGGAREGGDREGRNGDGDDAPSFADYLGN